MNYDHLMNNNLGWSSAEMWVVRARGRLKEGETFRQRIIRKFPFKLNPPKLRWVCIFFLHNTNDKNMMQILTEKFNA
jgi:hypothetical protein